MIKIIVAYNNKYVIGNNNYMLWNLKDDLNHFKNETFHKQILFGSKTFLSLPKNFNNRDVFVLTKSKNFENPKVKIVNNYQEIVKKYFKNLENEIFIAGGEKIYKLFINYADELIISHIENDLAGNKYFPKWNKNNFKIVKTKEFSNFKVIYYKRIFYN